jgi:ferritin-like metal-binding protein YciE
MSKQQTKGQEAFKIWYIYGLKALVSANEIGEGITEKLKKHVTSKELLKAIEQGSEATKKHTDIIRDLLKEIGDSSETIPNEIMKGIEAATDQIAESEDKDVRDAGVITSAQIALHYYIAAYGGLASTAKHLGLEPQAETFSKMADEVKKADEQYTVMAEESINEKASS